MRDDGVGLGRSLLALGICALVSVCKSHPSAFHCRKASATYSDNHAALPSGHATTNVIVFVTIISITTNSDGTYNH